jgi:hypothetical protein
VRIALLIVTLVFVVACPQAPKTRCLVDTDCGIGRTPLCFEGSCVECIRTSDCAAGLSCSQDNLCQPSSAEGEGEGEGARSGEGEGEGSQAGEGEGSQSGEGEGEGIACDLATCDAATEACAKLLPDDLSSCFEQCAPSTSCENVWGQSGACENISGQNVCVATGGVMSVCSAFGNSQCTSGLACVTLAPAVHQCVTDCTQPSDCTTPGFSCFDFGAEGKHCYTFAAAGAPCGFIADGTWRFCDQGFACSYDNQLPFGTCEVDSNNDGIPDGQTTNPDPTNPGGGEGEGEGSSSTAPPCGATNDCVIASFGTRSSCTTDAECNTNSISTNDACVKDSQGTGYCVLLSQDAEGLPCEQMPTSPRLTTVTGTDVGGATVAFCAHPDGVFCNVATSVCSGPPWP